MPKNQHNISLPLGSNEAGAERRDHYDKAAISEGLKITRWCVRELDKAAKLAMKRIKGDVR